MMDDTALERVIHSCDTTGPVNTLRGNRISRNKLISLLDNCRAVNTKVMDFKSNLLVEDNASSTPIPTLIPYRPTMDLSSSGATSTPASLSPSQAFHLPKHRMSIRNMVVYPRSWLVVPQHQQRWLPSPRVWAK